MTKEISKLNNNIEYIYKRNEDTPRLALCLNLSVNKAEEKAGIYSLLTRLLLQGTKTIIQKNLQMNLKNTQLIFLVNFSQTI